MNFCVIYLVIHYFVDKSNFKVGVLQKFVDVFKLVLFLICYFSVEIYKDRIRPWPNSPSLKRQTMCYLQKKIVFHQNLIKLGDVVALYEYYVQLHQVTLNSDENQKKVLYKTHLRDYLSIRSR